MTGGSSKSLLTTALAGIGLAVAVLILPGCGKGHSNSSSFTIGGTITGLTSGSSVVLVNGLTTVSVASTATTWIFPGTFAAGTSYSVAILTQPTGELCEVISGGTGATLTADVTTVTVACSPFGQWIWEAGQDTVNGSGAYGTVGAASASNLPGARYQSSSWTDASGDFWLFGGVGYDSSGKVGSLNDLWRYSPSTGQWTWINGGSAANAAATYGTQGAAAAANVPGARSSATSWIDAAGNLWLFGGLGYDSTGTVGDLNDLWRYSPGTGQWTWVSGGNVDNAAGAYGVQGTAAVGNVPGGRYAANSWIDSTGNLWLFGGVGYDSSGKLGNLNDLWKYSPASGLWAWTNGATTNGASGSYGAAKAAAATNVPGARQGAAAWIDSAGALWLFGGYGDDANGNVGYLNDLWQYNLSTSQWAWYTGGNVANASGVYGSAGVPSTTGTPGGRQGASAWLDASGNLWLFGGAGYGSGNGLGDLNDLWEYNPSTGAWEWVEGANTPNGSGAYGTQGSISASTAPGARYSASTWIDASGHLWLFGGAGFGSTGNGDLNDLWEFVPP